VGCPPSAKRHHSSHVPAPPVTTQRGLRSNLPRRRPYSLGQLWLCAQIYLPLGLQVLGKQWQQPRLITGSLVSQAARIVNRVHIGANEQKNWGPNTHGLYSAHLSGPYPRVEASRDTICYISSPGLDARRDDGKELYAAAAVSHF
jgi:hypothetical protein